MLCSIRVRSTDIISDSDMPSYGYRPVWGILRKLRCAEELPPVNAKRLYRIMREHHLLLHDKSARPKREHKGKIAVAESDMRWCSDGFEFNCDNGEKLRVTFSLDCCDTGQRAPEATTVRRCRM